MDAKRTQSILNNCHSLWRGQYQEDTKTSRGWVKLTPQTIIDLLDDCAFSARYEARQVLDRMETSKGKWYIRATAHQGGMGDARGADANLHITLEAGGIAYHLRCKELPQLHVIQITR